MTIYKTFFVFISFLIFYASPASAGEAQDFSAEKSANPLASLISVRFEYDTYSENG